MFRGAVCERVIYRERLACYLSTSLTDYLSTYLPPVYYMYFKVLVSPYSLTRLGSFEDLG